MDLETQYEAIEAAICQEIKSGTNLHAGILAGKLMLDHDTGVADERKTLVVVSDGITYMFNENPTAVAWGFMADSPNILQDRITGNPSMEIIRHRRTGMHG